MQLSRILFAAVAVPVTLAGACQCGDPLQQLAPKIEIGDPFDTTLSVCATDFVRDCKYNFGDVVIGQSRVFSFMIKNPSSADLLIKGITIEQDASNPFTLEGEVPEIVENEIGGTGRMVTIKLTPQFASSLTAKVIIESDAKNLEEGENVVIELTASGTDPGTPECVVNPAECDFGDVGVGATGLCSFAIENPSGHIDCLITDVGFSDGTQPTFGAQSPFITPATIHPGGSVSVTLYARPASVDVATGELWMDSNDPAREHIVVPLRVRGAQAPTAVARVSRINGAANNVASPPVEPLDDVELSGDQSVPGRPGGNIQSWQWQIVSKPVDSTVTLTAPTSRETKFQFSSAAGITHGLDVAGTFEVRLTVTDDVGAVSTNDARVVLASVPTEGFHVQLTWDTSGTDIDLHVVKGTTATWCSTANDCYYGNKSPNWDSAAGFSNGDPSLDVDDLDGFGPENTNIESPVDGSYIVGVNYYSGAPATNVSLKIYVGGALQEQMDSTLQNSGDMWTALRADVSGGVVTISPLDQYSTNPTGTCLGGGFF